MLAFTEILHIKASGSSWRCPPTENFGGHENQLCGCLTERPLQEIPNQNEFAESSEPQNLLNLLLVISLEWISHLSMGLVEPSEGSVLS